MKFTDKELKTALNGIANKSSSILEVQKKADLLSLPISGLRMRWDETGRMYMGMAWNSDTRNSISF